MLKFSGHLLLSQDTLHRDLFQWYVKIWKCIYRLRTLHMVFITRPPWGRIFVGGQDFTARQGKEHMRFPRAKTFVGVRCTIQIGLVYVVNLERAGSVPERMSSQAMKWLSTQFFASG